MKKNLTMFGAGFLVMLLAGVAAAQVGVWDSEPVTQATIAQESVARMGESPPTTTEETISTKPTETTISKPDEPAEKETLTADKDTPPEKKAEEPTDTTPPEIVILHPAEGQVFTESKIAYEGKTEPGARVFAGDYEADVDVAGNWRIVLILSPGANKTTMVAKDPAGNKATASVTAVLDAPSETEKPKEVGFTANQKFGETAEGYEKFFGTGQPGSMITVTSDYGSVSTEVSKYGEWLVKLHFDAPAGTAFKATVQDSAGHSKVFTVHVVAKPVKEFSVKQKYGSSSENPPYEKFIGTGAPGTVVEVGSKYGSGRIVIDESGSWYLKIVFEGATPGETFELVLTTTAGHNKTFSFTVLEPGTTK